MSTRHATGVGLLLMALAAMPVGAEESFDYYDNSWNVVGLTNYAHGTRITPDNALLIGTDAGTAPNEAEKATVRIRYGNDLTPLSRAQTKRLMDGWLPVVLLDAMDGPVRYEFTLWASPLPTVKNWREAYERPVAGENFLTWMSVHVVNTNETAQQGRLRIEPVRSSTEKNSAPVLTQTLEFDWALGPGETGECAVAIPWQPVEMPEVTPRDAKLWLKRTRDYWHNLMEKAASIEVPCKKAAQALRAAHVCQLIASDNGELHAGEGFYDEFYIRDGAYQVMELEEAGLWGPAADVIDSILEHQREDGRFESQKNQWDANGQAVWALWQYYLIMRDRRWLDEAYPRMRRAADWAAKARREAPTDLPLAGLLPAAPADGESLWDGKHHALGYDFWNLRGMLCTAEAAAALGKSDEAEHWKKEAETYRADIDRAWQRTGLPHFPPSWEKEGTHWGNTETLWPTPIFAYDDARVTALMEEVRKRHLGGFVEGTIRWTDGKIEPAIHPYMSLYTTMASLARGEDEKVVEEFYWCLLHTTAAHAFPEGVFYERRFAWSNTIPHALGASNYALQLRHMLVHEQDGVLHLLKAVPDGWLDAGKEIRIDRLPTHFGPMSLRVRGTDSGVRVDLDPPKRNAPKRIVLHLPTSRPLEGTVRGVEVVTRKDQTVRWDFDGVVARYKATRKAPG